MAVAAVLTVGCDRLFGLDTIKKYDDADVDLTIDAYIGPDASTVGWPTDGGVAPRDCTNLVGDEDADGKPDGCDNCPLDFNANQADRDRDVIGDVCDPHPEFAVERLAYASGFNGSLAAEGTKYGAPGQWSVTGGVLQNVDPTQQRTLFVIAGGPWRSPVVELKIGTVQPNNNSFGTTGVYLIDPDAILRPEPRPDSLSCACKVADASTSTFRIVRVRDGNDGIHAGGALTTGPTTTLVCAAANNERPHVAALGQDVAPATLANWYSIDLDSSDTPMSRVGIWTYYAQAAYFGIAVYETTYP